MQSTRVNIIPLKTILAANFALPTQYTFAVYTRCNRCLCLWQDM